MVSRKSKPEKRSKLLRGGNEVEGTTPREAMSHEKENDWRCGETFEAEAKESYCKQGIEKEGIELYYIKCLSCFNLGGGEKSH